MQERKVRPRGVGVRAVAMAAMAAIVMSGCVTVKKAPGTPETLRQAIRTGGLVKPGDRVTVMTSRIGERTFRVAGVDGDFIRGEDTQVPIDEIVALEKHRFDPVKTAGVVAGGYLGLALLIGLAFAVSYDDV